MNNFSPLFQKSIGELDGWFLERPNLLPEYAWFLKQIKELLAQAYEESSVGKVEELVRSISHMTVDGGPAEALRAGFLPSFNLVVTALEKSKKRSQP